LNTKSQFEAISVYYVDGEGLIYKHVLENIVEDEKEKKEEKERGGM